MTAPARRRLRLAAQVSAVVVSAWALIAPAAAESVFAFGPRAVQSLIVEQLFDRTGRWLLIDDGGCHTYLDSPHALLQSERVVLHAHLTARLGQSIGDNCAGADFASNVTLSGKLHGDGHALILDDIRVDRVDDESARDALNLALQVDPQALPRSATIDVSEFVRKQLFQPGGSPARLDEFRILNVTTRADAVVIHFDLRLSAP